jgi:hypothetical protein
VSFVPLCTCLSYHPCQYYAASHSVSSMRLWLSYLTSGLHPLLSPIVLEEACMPSRCCERQSDLNLPSMHDLSHFYTMTEKTSALFHSVTALSVLRKAFDVKMSNVCYHRKGQRKLNKKMSLNFLLFAPHLPPPFLPPTSNL